ncbi:hypothetical protein SFUMM280S_09159 [Streptomyces fumanus]
MAGGRAAPLVVDEGDHPGVLRVVGDLRTDIGRVTGTEPAVAHPPQAELLNRRITLDPAKDPATDSTAVVYDDRQSPYHLNHYRELERVTAEWRRLAARAERIGAKLPAEHQDAYFQLVRYQVEATANLYALREAEFTNLHYAAQGRAGTNALADATDARFADDQALSDHYNNELAGGSGRASRPSRRSVTGMSRGTARTRPGSSRRHRTMWHCPTRCSRRSSASRCRPGRRWASASTVPTRGGRPRTPPRCCPR